MTDIVIIGEAYGAEEERERQPFVGAAGYALTLMLEEAGIRRADCYLTNVFNLRPSGNKIEELCGKRSEGVVGYPALSSGKYIRSEFKPELDRLALELIDTNPNIIITMGNVPKWVMLGTTTPINKVRGATAYSTHCVEGFKVLPTYHPAATFPGRTPEARPIIIADLMKAKRESAYPEIRRPKREIWIEPTLEDIYAFDRRYIQRPGRLAVDIETSGQQITCIGFAPSSVHALVIPFHQPGGLGGNYWPTKQSEHNALNYVRGLLLDAHIRKTFQNGLYDIAFIWRTWGFHTLGADEDTMLLHHALLPESLKALGFLGSIYTDEGAWKQMRQVKTIKRDE